MSIVYKAKAEEKKLVDPQKSVFMSFETKTLKKNISSYFSFVLAFKKIDAQMLFWSIFFKIHSKKLIIAKNSHYGVFDGL